MFLFAHDLEPRLFVDISRRMKNALGPKRNSAVPESPPETDAFVHEDVTQTSSTRCFLDEQKPKLDEAAPKLGLDELRDAFDASLLSDRIVSEGLLSDRIVTVRRELAQAGR